MLKSGILASSALVYERPPPLCFKDKDVCLFFEGFSAHSFLLGGFPRCMLVAKKIILEYPTYLNIPTLKIEAEAEVLSTYFLKRDIIVCDYPDFTKRDSTAVESLSIEKANLIKPE